MEILKAKLTERIKRTPSVESFRFAPEKRIEFIPGQFLQVMFDPDNPQNKELNKYLSFSCAAGKPYIEVTKRISESEFSRHLTALRAKDVVTLKAPLGACVFKEEYKKIAFLIGGIGITPVISIIEYIAEKKLDTGASLFYSNRNEEDIAFKKELDGWSAQNKNIKVFYAVTDYQPRDKNCVFGRITQELLAQSLKDIKERIIFIFGPPKMVEAMEKLCLDMGCRNEDLKTESFLGY